MAAPAPLGTKQVEAQHYFDRGYDTPKRFASYWHQIDLALAHGAKSALEIGPGNGFLSSYLRRAGLDVTTLDLDPALRPSVAAALPHLPFADASFDVVIAYEVLEHIPFERVGDCLREIARVSRGRAAISVPDVERTFKLQSAFGKWWSFRVYFTWPRLLFKPKHRFNGEHHWELGKRGYPARRFLDLARAAGFACERDWRPFEHPYHHFFDFVRR